jgi:SAM-dependent methyltransferase
MAQISHNVETPDVKSSSITVLWPELSAPDIEEIRFSYDFCRTFSKQFCDHTQLDVSWKNYRGKPYLAETIPLVKGDMLLYVSDPEIILSPSAIRQLIACGRKGYAACGPVYNESEFPQQTAVLPTTYVDMDTFLEISESIEQQEGMGYLSVDALHPACILYRLDFLKTLDPELPLTQINGRNLKADKGGAAVSKGALVHIGFYKGLETERPDLVRLIPSGIKSILDVGCARGGYGRMLQRLRPEIQVTGLEINPDMAAQARPYYREVLIGSVENVRISNPFDLINCGDILEHLKDPWTILKRMNALLKTDGYLVLSIPNAGHWSVARALLKGEFQYIPLGLVCIGHLRWFTESSIRKALQDAGFRIDALERQQIPPTPSGERFIQEMCRGRYGEETSLRTNELIITAVKQARAGPDDPAR